MDDALNRFEWLEIFLRVILIRYPNCKIDLDQVPEQNKTIWICGVKNTTNQSANDLSYNDARGATRYENNERLI